MAYCGGQHRADSEGLASALAAGTVKHTASIASCHKIFLDDFASLVVLPQRTAAGWTSLPPSCMCIRTKPRIWHQNPRHLAAQKDRVRHADQRLITWFLAQVMLMDDYSQKGKQIGA